EELPRFTNLPLIVKVAMAIGVVLMWALVILAIYIWLEMQKADPGLAVVTYTFLGVNLIMSLIAYALFRRWRNGIWNLLMEKDKNGSARFATVEDLKDYLGKDGLYLGGRYTFSD